MVKKPQRRTLSAALAREGEGAEPHHAPGAVVATPEAAPAPSGPETVRYTAYLPKPVYRQLKELAYTHDRKMHDFVLEGLDLVFKEHGLRSIKELMPEE